MTKTRRQVEMDRWRQGRSWRDAAKELGIDHALLFRVYSGADAPVGLAGKIAKVTSLTLRSLLSAKNFEAIKGLM